MIDKPMETNENKYIKDMTEGEPLRLLISFSIPLLIGNFFQQAYNFINSIILGKYVGKLALGAIGSTSPIRVFINSLSSGLIMGVGIIVSQFFGAKQDEKVKNVIGNSFFIIFIINLFMGFLGFFLGGYILYLLHTPIDTLPLAEKYLKTISIGFIPKEFLGLLSCILKALGDSRTPFRFLIVGYIINIILDYIFVIKFNFGVIGVGLATTISKFVGAFLCLIYAIISNSYFRLNIVDFICNSEIIYKIIKVGIPVAGQNSLIAFSLIALQRVVNSFGSDLVTAFTVVTRIEQLVQHPFMSLGAAIATYTGQNIGAGKIDRVKLGFKRSVTCNTGFAIFIFLVFQIYAVKIVKIFGSDPTVVDYSVTGLKITCSFYIFLGLIHTTRNVLNGAGDANFCLLNGIVECIGRVGFARPLTMIPFIGLNGVWLTTGITWLLNGLFSLIRYKNGKWKTTALVNSNIVLIK